MSSIAEKFQKHIVEMLETISEGQQQQIKAAAELVAETIKNNGIIQSFGSGHSYASALEISGRAGGFIQTKIIQEPARGMYEAIEGVGTEFFKQLRLKKEDLLILISNSGRNPLSIEIAMEARKMHVPVIVVTALAVSASSKSRHSSGKLLYELADVVLDNRSTEGDACIAVEGLPVKVGGTSYYTGSLLLDCVMMEAMQILLDQGIAPPLFMSANVDEGREYNQKLLDQFKDRLALY